MRNFEKYPNHMIFVLPAKTNNRYKFSVKSGEDPALRNFTIENLQFSDKGVYKCIAERTDSTVTKEWTLRVRGKLITF